MNNSTVLSDLEVAEICAPLRSGAAQGRYLRNSLGIEVRFKPNGRPLVSRLAVERALLGAMGEVAPGRFQTSTSEPDTRAFLELLASRKRA